MIWGTEKRPQVKISPGVLEVFKIHGEVLGSVPESHLIINVPLEKLTSPWLSSHMYKVRIAVPVSYGFCKD